MTNYSTIKSEITLRAVIIGLLLIPANAYWVTKSEVVLATTHATTLSLFFNVIFVIFFLSMLNIGIKRFFPRYTFSSGELLTIYCMLSIATSLLGWDMMQILVPIMSYGTWFATPENEWRELFWEYIPKQLVVDNKSIIRGYYEGQTNLYDIAILKAWIKPILLWTAFTLVLYFTMICIVTLIRKRWTEEEKLSYPIIQLPFEMTVHSSQFYKSRSMWIAFGIAFMIDMLNELHLLIPSVPYIRTRYELALFFTEPPWNSIGWLPICIYPFVIGLYNIKYLAS